MSFAGIIEMDLRSLANEVKKKASQIRKDAESGIETLLVLSKKHPDNPKKMRSTDYVTPFIDCLNNEKVSEKAYDIALNGLNHVLAYNLASDATASTIVDILNDRLSGEDTSSSFGTRILQIIPVLLENSSFIIPEQKLQSFLCHTAQVLCSEDDSSIVYNSTLACFQQILVALSKHVTRFATENPKKSSSKAYDSIREKAPKSLSDSVYCSVFWYVIQDFCARLQEKDAAWLSNTGDLAAVRLSPQVCIELLLQVISSSKDILSNRYEYSALLNYLLVPAFASVLKEEKVSTDLCLGFCKLMTTVFTELYSILPSVESVLSTLTSQFKRIAKKKLDFQDCHFIQMEFVLGVLKNQGFMAYCCKTYTATFTGLCERIVKLFDYAADKSHMSSLIPAFELFAARPFKELKKTEAKREEEEESEEEEEVKENERMCCLLYHCTTAIIEDCIDQVNELEPVQEQMSAFVKDVLTIADGVYQRLTDKHCGETIYKHCLQSLASLCPLYGMYGLKAEQATIAHFVCTAALPSMKPKDAFKKTVDSIFTSRNLAAIEALALLCKGTGKGLETCWKLVTATLEVISEYIPSKDNENNYLSPTSPCVCAEFEIIEEQLGGMVDVVSKYEDDALITTLRTLMNAAKRGIASECMSGKMNVLSLWKEIAEELEIETKIKEEKSSPVQSTASLQTLLLIANKNVGRLVSLLPALSELITEAVSQLRKHLALPSLTQTIMFFISEVLEQINEHHPQQAEYEKAVPALLKVVNALVINNHTQAQALDTLYDVIIQGDCLKNNWKSILSCLKKIATTDNCAEGFHDVQLIMDDFISEMDFTEAMTLGSLIAAYTRQAFDVNIALSAIGLYWKLADLTLITAREATPGERPEIVRKMRQEIILTIMPTCMDNRPNIRNTAIQTLFQILVLQHGGFIFDDYLEVVESITSLASKLDRIRVNGYQEGDTTPIEDEENIRRHHTRDTVEKQFNETYCYLLKGMGRLLKLFMSHLLKKVRGDAIAEYLKVFKSVIKFYGKCLLIPEGKEVPSTTLTLYQEMINWVEPELSTNTTAQSVFALLIGRLLDVLAKSEIGKNKEGDDLLVDICNCIFSLLKQFTSYFLDPYQSYFTPLLSTLVALNVTDAVSLETGAGNKYNTNRPKGKLNSMQKQEIAILTFMYDKMKENPAYLIDYKSFIAAVDEIKATAEAHNATHANDVFVVAIEEFKNTLMKRKEARAIVKEYVAKQEEEETKRLKALLGNACLDPHPIFDNKRKPQINEVLSALESQWKKLEEVEDGDNAKALLFFLNRNCSILSCIFGDDNIKQMLLILSRAVMNAFGRIREFHSLDPLCKEDDVERKIFVDNAMGTFANLAKGVLEDQDGKKNETLESSCNTLSEAICEEAGMLFEKTVKECLKKARESENVGADMRKVVVYMIELVEKADRMSGLKEELTAVMEWEDTTIAQAAAAVVAKIH